MYTTRVSPAFRVRIVRYVTSASLGTGGPLSFLPGFGTEIFYHPHDGSPVARRDLHVVHQLADELEAPPAVALRLLPAAEPLPLVLDEQLDLVGREDVPETDFPRSRAAVLEGVDARLDE